MIEREATTIHGPLAHDGSIAFPRMWTGDDTLLVLYAVLGVALIVVLITSPLKLHPFLALLIGSTMVGRPPGSGRSG